MKEKIENFLNKYNLLFADKIYIIGFSGGYDSMCLIDILLGLSKEYGFKLIAAHLNHNWRGQESKQEEQSCREYCEEHGIAFYSKTLSFDIPKTELEARNQRYIFFEEAVKEYNADGILTGHTKSDNVETILYRIIKGTGLKGLKGIPDRRMLKDVSVFRPMLDITREETIRYCEENNLSPNVDSSNENIHYQRNKIRLKLIPELKNYNSSIEDSVLRLGSLAQSSEALISELMKPIKENIIISNVINTQLYISSSIAVKNQIIVDFLEANNIEYDYKKVADILSFIEESAMLKSGNTLSVTTDKWIFVSVNEIKIINETRSGMVKSVVEVDYDFNSAENITYHPDFGKTLKIIRWDAPKPDKFPDEAQSKAFVDFSNIDDKLFLRSRQEGDRITPFGMKESTKLKKYLINKGIPEHERDNLLILASESEVLWVAGIGISEKLRVKNKPTHMIEIL